MLTVIAMENPQLISVLKGGGGGRWVTTTSCLGSALARRQTIWRLASRRRWRHFGRFLIVFAYYVSTLRAEHEVSLKSCPTTLTKHIGGWPWRNYLHQVRTYHRNIRIHVNERMRLKGESAINAITADPSCKNINLFVFANKFVFLNKFVFVKNIDIPTMQFFVFVSSFILLR